MPSRLFRPTRETEEPALVGILGAGGGPRTLDAIAVTRTQLRHSQQFKLASTVSCSLIGKVPSTGVEAAIEVDHSRPGCSMVVFMMLGDLGLAPLPRVWA